MPGADGGSTVKPLRTPQSQLDAKGIRRWGWINARPLAGEVRKAKCQGEFYCTLLLRSLRFLWHSSDHLLHGYFNTQRRWWQPHILNLRVDVIQQPPYSQGSHQKGSSRSKGAFTNRWRDNPIRTTQHSQVQQGNTFGFWKRLPGSPLPPLQTPP